MKVKLISHTIPVDNSIPKNLLELVAYIARVSNPSSQIENMNSGKLLDYLERNNHWSPFEMVNICIEIETTRDIARQILRHRSFSFQEFSQRYADPSEEGLTFSLRPARMQDSSNRQNSTECNDKDLMEWWVQQQKKVKDVSLSAYTQALEKGIAKEVARALLPEGMTGSRLYMNGSLRSWLHYIELREGNGTQLEHQEIAVECSKIILKLMES